MGISDKTPPCHKTRYPNFPLGKMWPSATDLAVEDQPHSGDQLADDVSVEGETLYRGTCHKIPFILYIQKVAQHQCAIKASLSYEDICPDQLISTWVFQFITIRGQSRDP